MARLRYNGLTATLGAPLTAADTTITLSAPLTHAAGTVPTLGAGDEIPLTILGPTGAPAELVTLTGYTSGELTGTISRGQESTTAVAHTPGMRVVHALTVGDFGTADGVATLDEAGLLPEAQVPTRLTEAELSASYAARGMVQSPSAAGALIGKLLGGVACPAVTLLGDSTGVGAGSWFSLCMTWLGQQFPDYTLRGPLWDHAAQGYLGHGAVQVGTGGLRRHVTTNVNSDRFFTIADSAATSPTGDLDVRFKVMLPTAAPSGSFSVGGKYATATNNRSWFLEIQATGKLALYWSTDGTSTTQQQRLSSAPLPAGIANSVWWLRATLDVDNGAGGHDVMFWYSQDNATWTQLGTTVTVAGATSVFDSTGVTQFIGRTGSTNSANLPNAEFYAMQVYKSLAAGVAPVIDVDMGAWDGYSGDFPDFAGNVVTVAGGTTGTVAGAPTLSIINGSTSGQTVAYSNDATRFPKQTPFESDICFINYSLNETTVDDYRGAIKQLADAVLAKWPDCGVVLVGQNPKAAPIGADTINKHALRVNQVRSLAASQRLGFLDFYRLLSEQPELISGDGIHPTPVGYQAEADLAEAMFAPWL